MKKKNLLKTVTLKSKQITGQRKPGALKGKIIIKKDFDLLSYDFMKYFK